MPISRRAFLTFAAAGATAPVLAQPPVPVRDEPLIAAPDDPREWPAFREALAGWRAATRARLVYSDALYRRPEFRWVSSCYCCGFLMLCDEALYDRKRRRWTLEPFLDSQARDFGGFDAVVLWHAYPRIGLDDRNQFDFYRDAPGGLAGLRRAVGALHRHGVRAFVDYNPWDTGTRREPVSDTDALCELVRSIAADGIFLDTMSEGASELRRKLDAARPGVVLEGEGALPVDRVCDHHMSWAQWFGDSQAPGVLRDKWLERRHMQHQIARWSLDHTTELHEAWMNGSGMMVWENVFGSWVGWCARDRSLLRAMLPIQRRYTALFSGEGWTPLVPCEAPGIYASLWEGQGLRLWTLVNRTEQPVDGPLLRVPASPSARWFDLVAGRELNLARDGAIATVTGRIGPRGIGAILCGAPRVLGPDFGRFLARQARLAATTSGDTHFPSRTARLAAAASGFQPGAGPHNRLPVIPSGGRNDRSEGSGGAHPADAPPGMAGIPGTAITLRTEFRARECGFYDAQHPPFGTGGIAPLHGRQVFERSVVLAPYAIDTTPVTNAQFGAFLHDAAYRPADAANFLRHWAHGAPPAGMEDHPVVWVDLEDARAYARWAGKRLSTEEEWQYAAAGSQSLRYPWGERMEGGRCNGGESGGTTPVDAYPSGRSPFGCLDMCGNVWEWTESERADGRTRFAILKGGSFYRARGSDWYFDGGPQSNTFAAKMLLAWPALDRCATVGFRCARSL